MTMDEKIKETEKAKEEPKKDESKKDDKKEEPKEDKKEEEKCNKLKSKKKKKNVDTDEEEDDEEEIEKAEDKSPIESTPANSEVTGSGPTQQVFVPQTNVTGDRMAQGNSSSPSNVSFSGKSVSPELMKSPLFTELSKQLEGISKTVGDRLNSIEKSVNDRIANVQKATDAIEKFYKQPLYKSIDHSIGAEEIQKLSIKEQMDKGKVKFSD